jgi:hypothetical protein
MVSQVSQLNSEINVIRAKIINTENNMTVTEAALLKAVEESKLKFEELCRDTNGLYAFLEAEREKNSEAEREKSVEHSARQVTEKEATKPLRITKKRNTNSSIENEYNGSMFLPQELSALLSEFKNSKFIGTLAPESKTMHIADCQQEYENEMDKMKWVKFRALGPRELFYYEGRYWICNV